MRGKTKGKLVSGIGRIIKKVNASPQPAAFLPGESEVKSRLPDLLGVSLVCAVKANALALSMLELNAL